MATFKKKEKKRKRKEKEGRLAIAFVNFFFEYFLLDVYSSVNIFILGDYNV